MLRQDLFNKESICIFSDSSFTNESGRRDIAIGTTAPAYCVYQNDMLIEQGFHILHNSSSQQGEMYAVLLGIMAAYKYRNFKHIRLFSDSQNCIFAIRDRIFKWVRETNNGRNTLGDNGRISNQDFIMDAIYYLISNNIPMEFYHVKGHVNVRKYNDIIGAKSLFLRSNFKRPEGIEDALIYQISNNNNCVDTYSTSMLHMYKSDDRFNIDGLVPAVTIGYAPFDMRNYMGLVNKTF